MKTSNGVETISDTHITVCIPTFRRPELLRRLLNGISKQETADKFTIDIVVVDNDQDRSAQDIVDKFKSEAGIPVLYCVEPVQNISLTRNRAIDNSRGDYIAFIDDDEHPTERWLLNLLNTLNKYNADGALGPVLPYFESEPPTWLIKSGFCNRPRYETGTTLHWNQTRTGNVLLKASMVKDLANRFRPEFGLTGGEDSEFFMKLIKDGYEFIWCDEAEVYETVPYERWKPSFYIRKYFRIGSLTGEKVRSWDERIWLFPRSMVALFIWFTILPFSVLGGRHKLLKVLTKVVYYSGWLLGFSGIVFLRYRDDLGKGI